MDKISGRELIERLIRDYFEFIPDKTVERAVKAETLLEVIEAMISDEEVEK